MVLDLSPLGRGAGVRARLRSLGASPLLLVGATIGVLLLVVPTIALLAVVLGTGATDWGLVAFMAMLIASGVWVVVDVLRKAGTGSRLLAFARANDLELTRSLAAREYAGRRFRSGERIILHSLRTRTVPALEVGDTWPTRRVRVRVRSSGTVSAANAPQAEGFLRVVLPGRGHAGHEVPGPFPMSSELDAALGELLGPYSLEVHDGELTVMGSLPLAPSRPERVTAAFDLAAALARRAGAAATTPAGAAPRGTGRRSRHPLVIIGAVLAMLVVVPVAFAIVMSVLDDHIRGEAEARAVVGLLIVVITAIVAFVIRWATSRRRRPRGEGSASARREDRRSSRS